MNPRIRGFESCFITGSVLKESHCTSLQFTWELLGKLSVCVCI